MPLQRVLLEDAMAGMPMSVPAPKFFYPTTTFNRYTQDIAPAFAATVEWLVSVTALQSSPFGPPTGVSVHVTEALKSAVNVEMGVEYTFTCTDKEAQKEL
jgi:hypothetical protein